MSFVDLARVALAQPPDPICEALRPRPPRQTSEQTIISVDLGQQADPTALAMLKQTCVQRGEKRLRYYDCPWLYRWPLKTPYDEIVEKVCKMTFDPNLLNLTVVVDMTGVGRAVVDMFRAWRERDAAGNLTGRRMRCRMVPITITGGNKVTPQEDGSWHVCKKELVSVMHVMLGGKRLDSEKRLFQVSDKLLLAKVLQEELEKFKAKISLTNPDNVSFEAWRAADHDDIVLAVALGAWVGERFNQRLVVG